MISMKTLTLNWQEIPAVRLVLPLLAGGFLYVLAPDADASLPLYAGLIILSMAGFWIKRIWSLCFYCFLFICGYLHFHHHDQALILDNQVETDTAYLQCMTVKDVKWDPKNQRWRGLAQTFISEHSPRQVNIYYWLERRDSTQNLTAGDQVLGRFSLRTPQNSQIPGAFDFRSYLIHKNIAYTQYIPKYIPYTIHKPENSGVMTSLNSWRTAKMSDIGKHTDTLTHSLLQAILFGDSQALPAEVRAQFADAGMAHILAVSGMHVGILVFVIQFLINHTYRRSKGKDLIQFTLILCFVWLYVSICEFAPSATRAAVMVSVYYLGKACKVPATAINTLAISALALFMWNPFMLLDLGAQLSFGAMFGILFTLPFWNHILLRWTPLPTSWVTLISLSFAAQIGVAPFLLYHFGHVPALFWLFSIPAGYLAIFLFIGGWTLVIFTDLLPAAAPFIGKILNWGLGFWSVIMDTVSAYGLPQLNWSFFPLSYLILTISLIAIFIRALYSQSKRQLIINFQLIPILLSTFIILHYFHKARTQFVPFEYKNQNYTVLKSGNKAYVFGKSSWEKKDSRKEVFSQLRSAFPINQWEYVKIENALLNNSEQLHSISDKTSKSKIKQKNEVNTTQNEK